MQTDSVDPSDSVRYCPNIGILVETLIQVLWSVLPGRHGYVFLPQHPIDLRSIPFWKESIYKRSIGEESIYKKSILEESIYKKSIVEESIY